jgi:starch phosphorylase
LELLTRDPEWTVSLLGGERPVQVVLGGKAHPRDEDAKRSLRRLFELKAAPVVGERVVFLDDYDLDSAACLVRGCDVWLNLPRPPLEASGTSGMKSVMNGGLQLSVLDGWWAEACDDGVNGWGLAGDVDADHAAQDERTALELQGVVGERVLPAFYERDERGLPTAWLRLMRGSLRTLGPRFGAGRMLGEYTLKAYGKPAGGH